MTKPKTPNPKPLTSNDVAIKVEGVYKSFKLPHEKSGSIKGALLGWRKRKRGYENQHVLKDVSFEIKKGEFFGIVGRNGSGKSTLLKLISQIYTPDKGSISVNGKLTPFIELGVGFNPELSGRDNVYLNGALLGFNREEMEAMYDEIVEFAELKRFMDQKLKNYSSGMQVRLAFSIAIRANTDILVLDEVLAVGDESFQRKCENYFSSVKKQGKTIILVTHSMDSVRKYCTRAILVSGGEVKMIGNPEKIADEYSEMNLLQSEKKSSTGKADENRPRILAKMISKRTLTPDDTVEIKINYRATDKRPVYAKVFVRYFDTVIMSTHASLIDKRYITTDTNEHEVNWRLSLKNFNKGEYRLDALIQDVETEVNIASYGYNGELVFIIENSKSKNGGAFANQGIMEWKK